ncbi:MAG: glycogen/starch/alpha-glucan phosphorylase [Acholeplasmataceae bacterium]
MTNKLFQNKELFKEVYINELKNQFDKTVATSSVYEKYYVLATLLDRQLIENYEKTNAYVKEHQLKKTIYFSMEFLMGRLITNNLQNSGHYDVVKEAFKDLDIDLNAVEHSEVDAGLGNGGLGRLAACFLDSAASVALPLYGNSLRYQYGFFTQEIKNHKQVEHADAWLEQPFVWETKKEDEAVDIPFFGYVERTKLIKPTWVKAVPYDVKIVGDQNDVVTSLRLWASEPSDLQDQQDQGYLDMVDRIDDKLYPDDSTVEGKTLRLQQSYLFSAAGIMSVINEHKRNGRDIRKLHEYYAFQINDTHPTLIIPELMRILMDQEGLPYDEAWYITTHACAFTNHTILSEALEKWDIDIFKKLLPRIYELVQEFDRRFLYDLKQKHIFTQNQIAHMAILGNHQVRMAHICIYGAFSVNGVAALHTEILKKIEMKDFYKMYPEKFNNKTNGITHRRWLIHTNKELVSILDDKIKIDWRHDLSKLELLDQFKDDADTQLKIKAMKLAKKQALADRILELEGVKLNVNSIFDIQVKRLHEYKRQLMNILHIIYVYQRLKSDQTFKDNYAPHSFIFGAKAAPSYYMAKMIIELIGSVADVVNQDSDTNELLKVVFVENYNVTYAEYIMPAADLSEQISTASKEASGTGNMKFMMNGAITIGTMDGANVEIVKEAGIENEIIFGMTSDEVNKLYQAKNYQPRVIYENDSRLIKVFDFMSTLNSDPNYFNLIKDNLLNYDYFFVLKDFDSYVKAHEIANAAYKDEKGWLKKSIMNIAHSGFFTSDRTIENYNKDIWHLSKIYK